MTTPKSEVPEYRKKPVIIHAMQLKRENVHVVREWIGGECPTANNEGLHIFTLEGTHLAKWGDWIIQGVKGEFYPCKPDIFEQTYEPLSRPREQSGGGEERFKDVWEIVRLIWKLDDFCVGQFKKLLPYYVDGARNIASMEKDEQEEFVYALSYNLKRDLEHYIREASSPSPQSKEMEEVRVFLLTALDDEFVTEEDYRRVLNHALSLISRQPQKEGV